MDGLCPPMFGERLLVLTRRAVESGTLSAVDNGPVKTERPKSRSLTRVVQMTILFVFDIICHYVLPFLASMPAVFILLVSLFGTYLSVRCCFEFRFYF